MTRASSKDGSHPVKPHVIARSAQALRIIAFSDCRVQNIEIIVSWIKGRSEIPDLIIYAGDDIKRFVPDTGTNYFEQLASLSRYGIVAVTGNDDLPEVRDLIRGDKVYEVHSQPVAIGRFLVVGVEGAPAPGIGFTLHAESELAQHLRRSLPKRANRTIIVVSHAPPRGCLDEAIRFGNGPIGSTAVRDFVKEEPRVALVVSGHVHLCGGRRDKLGHAVVVNAASHDTVDKPARIATFLLQPSGVIENFSWSEVVSSIPVAEISGIGPKYATRLAHADITMIEHLADASPHTVGRALGRHPSTTTIFIARAQARLTGLPSLVSVPEIPKKPRLYLDIETDLQQSYTWLVGVATEESNEVRQFFAPHPSKEGEMLRELIIFLATGADHTVVHYSGNQFDKRILKERMESHGLTPPPSLLQSVDCLPDLRRTLALPTRGLTLKEAVEYLGYRFAYPELDGLDVALEYERAIRSGQPVPERLLAYNRDDVLALRFLVQEVERLAAKP